MSMSTIHAAALTEVQDEIRSLEEQLAEAKSAANYHASKLGQSRQSERPQNDSRAIDSKQSPLPSAPGYPLGGQNQRFATMRQIDAAAKILEDSGQPLKTAAIVQKMIEGGFPQRDTKKLTTSLFTSLTRKPDVFVKAGTGLWGLANTQS